MTRPESEYQAVSDLLNRGVAIAEVSRRTRIPRSTIHTWLRRGGPSRSATNIDRSGTCPYVSRAEHQPQYAYLLGLYLGDGYLVARPRGVYHLRITLDTRYTEIIAQCSAAIAAVLPNRVGFTARTGCVVVSAYSKHWPCLFPQHGSGRKHLRSVVLERWQREVAIVRHPESLLRGLIHSDGWRGTNVAVTRRGRYEYPRYQFSNRSPEIRQVFAEACRSLGIVCRQSNRWTMAVSRRADVAYLDEFIGPKR